jgi:hypothetical protein
VTTYGRKYLETTEPTHDDYNYPSGSYTSPNGSMGKLHLTWTVPFQPGTLTAVATAGDWVSVSWPSPQSFDSVQASFTISATLAQPAAITVSYWDGSKYVPVRNLTISRATASNQPTTLSFDPVCGSQVRVDMTSAAPGTAAGFLQIVELQVLSGGTAVS